MEPDEFFGLELTDWQREMIAALLYGETYTMADTGEQLDPRRVTKVLDKPRERGGHVIAYILDETHFIPHELIECRPNTMANRIRQILCEAGYDFDVTVAEQ